MRKIQNSPSDRILGYMIIEMAWVIGIFLFLSSTTPRASQSLLLASLSAIATSLFMATVLSHHHKDAEGLVQVRWSRFVLVLGSVCSVELLAYEKVAGAWFIGICALLAALVFIYNAAHWRVSAVPPYAYRRAVLLQMLYLLPWGTPVFMTLTFMGQHLLAWTMLGVSLVLELTLAHLCVSPREGNAADDAFFVGI